MHTTEDLKSQAKRLRTHLVNQAVTLSHSQALEAIAAAHGHKDWNTASAALALHADGSKHVTPALYQHLESLGLSQRMDDKEQNMPLTAGARISEARRALGHTQSELTAITGIGLVDLKRLESERSDPRSSDLSALLKAGINPMWVIVGETPMLTSKLPSAASTSQRDVLQSVAVKSVHTQAADKSALASGIRDQCDALLSVLKRNPNLFSDNPERELRLIKALSSGIDQHP